MLDIREDPKKVERAYLVALETESQSYEESQELLIELQDLVKNLNIGVVATNIVKIKKVNARYLIGTGKVTEILEECQKLNVDAIIFDDDLSPSQQRNWEKESKILTIDRREIILDIFAQRATTKEANLQVELAKAEYKLPRLTRAWTHLSRQRGGTNLRGEGETQIEVDRRLLRTRILKLQQELKKVRQVRNLQRKKRQKKPVPNAAIVGYTNAGKSSLLNALSQADLMACDKLFATLDPTTKRIVLKNNQELLLTDTVGFVRKLPHDLIEAFKATLEEALQADFLLHVIDISSPQVEEHIETTLKVLSEIGVKNKQIITVFNKNDKLDNPHVVLKMRRKYPYSVFISVYDLTNFDQLLDMMSETLDKNLISYKFVIPQKDYDKIALLHQYADVKDMLYEDNNVCIKASIPPAIYGAVKNYIIS